MTVKRPNWFKYYREVHNIPELGCIDDNELILVSRETLRLALHALLQALTRDKSEEPHGASLMSADELSSALDQFDSGNWPTMDAYKDRQLLNSIHQRKEKEAKNGRNPLRSPADVRPVYEKLCIRQNNRGPSWLRKDHGVHVRNAAPSVRTSKGS